MNYLTLILRIKLSTHTATYLVPNVSYLLSFLSKIKLMSILWFPQDNSSQDIFTFLLSMKPTLLNIMSSPFLGNILLNIPSFAGLKILPLGRGINKRIFLDQKQFWNILLNWKVNKIKITVMLCISLRRLLKTHYCMKEISLRLLSLFSLLERVYFITHHIYMEEHQSNHNRLN